MSGLKSTLSAASVITSMLLASFAYAEDSLQSEIETALIARDAAGLAAILADTTPELIDVDGRTPLLHRAVMTGDIDVVSAVLSAGLPVNALDPAGETALSLAVELGANEIAQILLDNFANPSISDRRGMLPWEIAARSGERHLAFRLLPNATRSRHATGWLFHAAEAGDVEAMRLAFAAGAELSDLNERGQTLLQVGVINQQWSVVQFLLDLPAWARATAINEESAGHLLQAALLAPGGSPQRHFSVRAIGGLLAAGAIEPDQFVAAAPAQTTDAGFRQLMQDLGLPILLLDRYFPPAIIELPPLEYSLPMNAPLDGITEEHWREVQQILRDEGLYDGPIDGIPGSGTFDGLYAYVVGLAPLLIERGQTAQRLAEERRPGYGPLMVRWGQRDDVVFLHGRVISTSRSDMATGYLALSDDRSFGIIRSYRYDFRSVPSDPSTNWRARAVSVDGCDVGRVIAMTATFLGRDLHIRLGVTHSIQFSGAERYRLPQEMPGDAPVIPCN